MNRNQIIDFLCDQSIDKEKVLYEMLKEESKPSVEPLTYPDPYANPQFVNRANCNKCRFYEKNMLGHYECTSNVAKEKCGHPEYKYFEER